MGQANTVFPKLFPQKETTLLTKKTYQLRQIDGFSVAFVKGKEQADRTQKNQEKILKPLPMKFRKMKHEKNR